MTRGVEPDVPQRERELQRAWFQDGLNDDDREWLREHIELAGQRVPTHDTSWIEWEYVC